jgi:hypothetical protein
MRGKTLAGIMFLALSFSPWRAAAPLSATNAQASAPLRVLIDCRGFGCDDEFFRTEITFVDHVRNRQDADVHILITTEPTAGGGTEYTLEFIGRRAFAGRGDTLKHVSAQNASADDVRRGLLGLLKIGLLRYAVGSPLMSRIKITYDTTQGATKTAIPATKDSWNYWVFRTGMNASFFGQRSTKSTYLSGNVSANRTTQTWKINLSGNGNYSENSFQVSDTFSVKSFSRSYSSDALLVKSLGKHTSAGLQASANHSTFENKKLALRFGPAFEYDIYPYSQSTRRQLTFRYAVGVNTFRYEELTIYERIGERKLDQTLIVTNSLQQKWGSLVFSGTASEYLDDWQKYSLGTFVNANLRLVKGLSLNGFVSASFLRNQLALAKRGVSEEEVLLQRRALATGYQFSGFLGISYSFGSIFNNIVNPRFSGGNNFFVSF